MDAEVKPTDETWQIALYQGTDHGYVTVNRVYPDDDKFWSARYVRLSEPVTVKFEPLRDEAVIQQAVAAFEAQERDARIECEKKIAAIRERKANLLALTHQPEPV